MPIRVAAVHDPQSSRHRPIARLGAEPDRVVPLFCFDPERAAKILHLIAMPILIGALGLTVASVAIVRKLPTFARAGRIDVEGKQLAGPIRGPATDLSEEVVVFLRGLQDPNREASRQQLDGRYRYRPRAKNPSPQNNRRRAIPWTKTNRDDGANVRWSGCPHEQAATRKVARNSCCSRFLDLEAYRDLRPPTTILSPLRVLFFRDH